MRLSKEVSDMFYDRALAFDHPFLLRDLSPKTDIAIRRVAAQQWLDKRVKDGEIRRVRMPRGTFYEWVNE